MEDFGAIANVPNSITAARLVGSVGEAAAYGHTGDIRHFIKAGAYFWLDVLDGPAARALHQETEFGASFDPVVDKASIAALGVASVVQHKADKLPIAVIGAINISNTAATVVAKKRGTLEEGVGTDGKHSQLGMNAGFGLNVIGNHLRESNKTYIRRTGTVLRHAGGALAIGSALSLGVRATAQYWRQATKSKV